MGSYKAQAIPKAWLKDPAIVAAIHADLEAVARKAKGDSPDQTREIWYADHVDPLYCTPTIWWVNHE